MDGIDEFKSLETLVSKWDILNSNIDEFNISTLNLKNRIAEFEALDGFADLVEQTKKDKIAEYKLKLEALNAN